MNWIILNLHRGIDRDRESVPLDLAAFPKSRQTH
jgi:hypothetical protein